MNPIRRFFGKLFDQDSDQQSATSPSPSSPAPAERVWDESSRKDLQDWIRNDIRGEVRLRSRDNDDILEKCFEAYIQDECPEEEWEIFQQIAKVELQKALEEYERDQETWPEETDCDRLDQVEKELRDKGILLWQVSPCCNSCSASELPDRIDEIDERFPGFRGVVRGYAFFHDQSMPDELADSTEISVYMSYGWFLPEDSDDVSDDEYEKHALGIAKEVCDCLKEHGFTVDWDGSMSRKIGINLNWRRRTMLQ
ncbi:MAG: hypothetical protein CMO55_12445 [Verrucomicrobiales bacterium]|nr:hypothetical protein [Verrucomicrobiales bacterium]